MAMNTKNWNDRADKDLFFTILSVKNIGVISGAEWTTIGNHMRALGYGFTNEGCRQHFQGLRRAQNKADANGAVTPESSRRVDPTLNPITRRPGPGRGRPRKQQQQQQQSEQQEQQSPQQHQQAQQQPLGPNNVHGNVSMATPVQMQAAVGGPFAGAMAEPYYTNMIIPPATPNQSLQAHGPSTPPQGLDKAAVSVQDSATTLASDTGVPDGLHMPQGDDTADADVDADGAESVQPEPSEENDDHPAKRQKMEQEEEPDVTAETEADPTHDPALEDEAVLALAEHNGFDNYGEA
ncbi:hypothetical protein CDD82_4820 [Ophiocordyceps australis]|uniref:Myb-like domain-containing protein n=1 Tax=Ophiocordyceps australis TaxID=1399860 RepID=A0A2C5Z4N8_9HYPO|nr:hypothetical protein CDD82_4820 [Ophiocordyceps australis]